jgi:ribosomal protein S20
LITASPLKLSAAAVRGGRHYAEELIAKTKGILATNNGANDPARLAADFNFVAPVVNPKP